MPRSQVVVALAAGLLILLSTINVYHRSGLPRLDASWPWHGAAVERLHTFNNASSEYLLGVGKADITGPVVEINFMGYANTSQLGSGLRQRLYSRAFIIGDVQNVKDRFIYLVLDTQSGDTAVRYGILEALASLGSDYAMYGQQNVAVTGTHSHSGPGAWLNYLLPQITSRGFHKPSYRAIVDGAVESIKLAHSNLAPGHLSVGSIEVEDANINRSPYAYLANPPEERARYEHDVDKMLMLLRFTHATVDGNTEIGVLTWFAVHGTSMHGNNTIVTGDNKGVAAWLFEQSMGDSNFVAGFSQANVGDTTPNINGAYCEYGEQEGQMCDFASSLCANRSEPCHGRGPHFGLNDAGTASTYEIGMRQFKGAKRLFDNSSNFTPVTGSVVKSLHQFVDFRSYEFALSNGTVVRTCPAALGYSFAAGTSDGPGQFDFKQGQPGNPNANPLWDRVGGLLHEANDTQRACHGVKPIVLDVGETNSPYPWSPNIVDVQLLRVGQLFIIVSPGEATTMAGRRWRDAVGTSAAGTLVDLRGTDPIVVLGAPANSYTHYISTTEEYSVQRYEGASTLYGPYTLDAHMNLSLSLLPYLDPAATGLPPLQPGLSPPNLVDKSLSFITGVIVDNAPIFKSFGDQVSAPKSSYRAGESISVTFVGANPRNNLRLGGTFAAVDRFDLITKSWQQMRDDQDWSLLYEWKRTSTIIGTSQVTITWETKWETGAWRPMDQQASHHSDLMARQSQLQGLYRIRYNGDAKSIGGKITAFEGTSDEFRIQ